MTKWQPNDVSGYLLRNGALWPFFDDLISKIEMVCAKADLDLAPGTTLKGRHRDRDMPSNWRNVHAFVGVQALRRLPFECS